LEQLNQEVQGKRIYDMLQHDIIEHEKVDIFIEAIDR
jgi:hypothetical protein